MRRLLFAIVWSFAVGCQPGAGNVKNEEQPYVPPLIKDSISSREDPKPVVLFKHQMPFEIISANRAITSSSSPDTNMCTGWTLSEQQIKKIISMSRPIDTHVWHYDFLVLPCIMEGMIRQKDQTFNFEINAGSWFRVHKDGHTFYYGNYHPSNHKYFLEKADSLQ